jgi:hemolysin activation/secretion protein
MSTRVAAENAPPLSATVIDGATTYSASDLFAIYRDQLGRPITSASAQSIVAQIEALYLRDGYSRPELRVHADMAADGILRVEIFEAQITNVIFSGDAGPYTSDLARIADELRACTPLRTSDLRRAVQRMRELPGLTVNASTRRDETRRNAHIVKVDTQFERIEGAVELSNRATRQIGPIFASGQLVANDLLGLRERAGVLFASANDQNEFFGAGAFIDTPLSDAGTRLSASAFSSRSNPTEKVDRNDRYLRDRVVVRATQPIDASDATRLAVSTGLEFDDLDITRNDDRLRNERLRIVELGIRWNGAFTPQTPYAYALHVRQGIDAFGAGLEARDLLVDRRRLDFTSLRLQLTQVYRFKDNWTMRIDALAQQSAYILPDAERYKIGGERLGRGFEVTEIAGDQGAGAKLELRRMLRTELLPNASVYGFYDFGAAWKQDGGERESASSSGLGFALEYGRLSGFVELAKPLTDADIEGDRNAKVFAEVRLKL